MKILVWLVLISNKSIGGLLACMWNNPHTGKIEVGQEHDEPGKHNE